VVDSRNSPERVASFFFSLQARVESQVSEEIVGRTFREVSEDVLGWALEEGG